MGEGRSTSSAGLREPRPGLHPPIRLTAFTTTGGCAAKLGQTELHAALSYLPLMHDGRLLVSHVTGDDAAVFELAPDLALVETVDIFPPIVDDPFDFGRIAAANALSDVYAMGARPINALSFVGWPVDSLGVDALGEVIAGAARICADAGIAISGGHSIIDEEPKFGLLVTGLADPRRIVRNSGARVGDVLVLTKKLGTGILTTAVKRGVSSRDLLDEAIVSMTTLNRAASEAMTETGAHAATDITGFGLLGHLGILLRASSVTAEVSLGARLGSSDIPLFPGTHALVEAAVCPEGTRRNLGYAAPHVRFAKELSEEQHLVLADAQTSGGLLIAVAEDKHDRLLEALAERGVEVRAVIGHVVAAEPAGLIEVI